MSKNMRKKEKTRQNGQKVITVNAKAKDTFFKRVYGKQERQREPASFLPGITSEKVSTANVRPVLFGNKENDFLCIFSYSQALSVTGRVGNEREQFARKSSV